jgi:FkbM family methyltransferase
MNRARERSRPDTVRPLRGATLLRGLHWILPLGRKYHPLLSALNGRRGLLAIPFDHGRLVQPALWAKQIAHQLLNGVGVVPEFGLLAPLVRPLSAGCLIDVGANIGLYTLLLRSVSRLPIIAYEPQPFLFKLLEGNIDFNCLEGVEVRNVACGSRGGRVPFALGINGSVAAGAKPGLANAGNDDWEVEAQRTRRGQAVVQVPVVRLDEDLAGLASIALLKIDCEGYEFDVLQGAQGLIERHAPVVFVEVHPTLLGRYGHSPGQVLEFFKPYYDLEFWCFDRGRRRSKLGRSLAKFRRPKGVRYADENAMLAAAGGEPRPAQIYFIGRPKRRAGVI